MTTTAAATIGDPLGHPGFVRREEEEAVVEERYDSDSDDDGDVDRYVFLARQPAAADGDDDDGAMPCGDGPARKRHRSEILAHASPSAKKARLGGAFPEESRSEGPVRSAERGVVDQGKKNKKRRRCGGEPQAKGAAHGDRSSGASREVSEGPQHRDVKTSVTAAAGAPRRFVCSLCGRCFGSHQALGGHVHLGHTKKAKNAIAAASHGDVSGDGCRDGKVAMADGAGHAKEKTAVAVSPGESDGDGKKTLGATACRQYVDSSSGDSDSNEEMFIGAADHGDHRGDGNVDGEGATAAIATSRVDTFGTESKFAVGRCHELTAGAVGNPSSIVRKTQYRCEVCGRECLSGQALGGHMRKHRKLSPHNGGKEQTSLEVANGAGRGNEKTVSPGEPDGDGKKTISAAACHQDVDSSSSGDSNRNEEEMFIGAANHGDGNGTERKIAVGRCRELTTGAIGNASSIVRKTQHRCEVCGKECLSGQALGGHMRKHRKRPPQDDGGKERTSPEADGITNQRGAVITNPHYGNRFGGSLIGLV